MSRSPNFSPLLDSLAQLGAANRYRAQVEENRRLQAAAEEEARKQREAQAEGEKWATIGTLAGAGIGAAAGSAPGATIGGWAGASIGSSIGGAIGSQYGANISGGRYQAPSTAQLVSTGLSAGAQYASAKASADERAAEKAEKAEARQTQIKANQMMSQRAIESIQPVGYTEVAPNTDGAMWVKDATGTAATPSEVASINEANKTISYIESIPQDLPYKDYQQAISYYTPNATGETTVDEFVPKTVRGKEIIVVQSTKKDKNGNVIATTYKPADKYFDKNESKIDKLNVQYEIRDQNGNLRAVATTKQEFNQYAKAGHTLTPMYASRPKDTEGYSDYEKKATAQLRLQNPKAKITNEEIDKKVFELAQADGKQEIASVAEQKYNEFRRAQTVNYAQAYMEAPASGKDAVKALAKNNKNVDYDFFLANTQAAEKAAQTPVPDTPVITDDNIEAKIEEAKTKEELGELYAYVEGTKYNKTQDGKQQVITYKGLRDTKKKSALKKRIGERINKLKGIPIKTDYAEGVSAPLPRLDFGF